MTTTPFVSRPGADARGAGVRELHGLLDRLHDSPCAVAEGSVGPAVVEVDRAIRRLCPWHHQRVHDHHFRHHWHTVGTVTFQRISPSRT